MDKISYLCLFGVSGTVAILLLALFSRNSTDSEHSLFSDSKSVLLFILAWWIGGSVMFILSHFFSFLNK